MKKPIRILAYVIGSIFLLLVLAVIFIPTPEQPAETTTEGPKEAVPATKTVKVGETGIIRTGVPGGVNEEAYDAVLKAATSKDREGLEQLVSSGNAVYIDNNTKVRVIDSGMFKKQVRLLSGDHKGASLWVPTEYVESE